MNTYTYYESVKSHKQLVDMFIITNYKYFPRSQILYLKDKLNNCGDDDLNYAMQAELKNPTVMFLISLFLGYLGIDRFLLDELGMGMLKMLAFLTFLGSILVDPFFVLSSTPFIIRLILPIFITAFSIFDWVTIQSKTRKMNYENIILYL